jgi:hypothetical protein
VDGRSLEIHETGPLGDRTFNEVYHSAEVLGEAVA